MKLWFDACVTPRLEDVAHRRGYEATSNRSRGLLTAPDSELYPVVTAEDWVLVTNNERDFRTLASEAELHPGLIVLPQGKVAQQQRWFDAVITHIEAQAEDAGEPAADWMICRVVDYDDTDDSVGHGWLPDPP